MASNGVYLIGPSGVGKTTAARALVDDHGIALAELDALAKAAAPPEWKRIAAVQHWRIVRALLEDLDARAMLVDIGAGTQDMHRGTGNPRFEQWLSLRRERIVLMTADPAEVSKRDVLKGRTLNELVSTEYTSRDSLYRLASITVDITGLDCRAAAQALAAVVLPMLTREPRLPRARGSC